MDIRQLRYFVTIAEEKQITSAAKVLNISQPPLSNQLKSLETELGVTLFIRKKKLMEITAEGERLLHHAKIMISNYNAIVNEFNNIKEGYSGILRIGTIGTISMGFLPKSINDFLKTTPKVEFQIHESSSIAALSNLDKDLVDIAIIKENFNHSHYNYLVLKDDRYLEKTSNNFVAIGCKKWFEDIPSESISLAQLSQKPLIVHAIDEKKIVDACAELGFNPQIMCSNESITSSISWALNGLGVSIISQSSAKVFMDLEQNQNIEIHPLQGQSTPSRITLVWKKNQELSHLAQRYVDMLRNK